jgi:hypothetical protein
MKKSLMTAALLAAFGTSAFAATTADVVVLMDESGSMSGEQAWMSTTIPQLDSGLLGQGLSGNRYGLVGFGASSTTSPAPGFVRSIDVGGAQFGTAAQYTTASSGLVVNGSFEDGYAAIDLASSYSFRSGAARNFILVSDEDRDVTSSLGLGYDGMLAGLKSTGTLLNSVVDASFKCGDGSAALGLSSGGKGYKVDGAGGFTTCSGASFVSGFGTTGHDYVDLALASGGAAWDLKVLRAGGLGATSFTKAFIDVKVHEIVITPTIPEPSTYALMLGGLAAVGFIARRRKQAK